MRIIQDYLWEFTENDTRGGVRQSHTYPAPGVYIVKLTVTDNSNLKDTDHARVVVKTRGNYPDLAVFPGDIGFFDNDPMSGDMVTISAGIHNLGNLHASNVLVQVWDGAPETGSQIGSDQIIQSIVFGETETIQVEWNTASLSGQRTIYVTVDPNNDIEESDETNNVVFSAPFMIGNFYSDLTFKTQPDFTTQTIPLKTGMSMFQNIIGHAKA